MPVRKTYYYQRIILISSFILFVKINGSGQLLLQQTNWRSTSNTEGKLKLQFTNDTLFIQQNNTINTTFTFKQKQDTIFIFNTADKDSCQSDTGIYRIMYNHRGQELLFVAVTEKCNYRKEIFLASLPYNFIPSDNVAFRNWSDLDPEKDSVAGINLYKAYDLLKGKKSKQVIVAVIDNGVDIDHEDLKNLIWINKKEIPNNGIDDDHNGYIDDVHGWNFRSAKDGTNIENEQAASTQFYSAWKSKFDNAVFNLLSKNEKKEYAIFSKAKEEYFEKLNETKDSGDIKFAYNLQYNSSDLIGDNPADFKERFYGSPNMRPSSNLKHGTYVAGIIAAQRNNDIGIDGIADNVLIMPIVASAAIGDERDKDIANAIRYAVDNGASIINISFDKSFSSHKKLVDNAIGYAGKKNVLIIHSAGNYHVNIDTINYYPIALFENGKKAANFIAVGWSRPLFNYRLAHPNSCYGKKNVDLFAPGSDILTTSPGNEYDFRSGSSMSSPMVSGVAALLLSYFPELTIVQVKDIILRSAYKPNIMVNKPGTKTQVPFSALSATGGIVNTYNAVKLAIEITKK
jgi:subtilisin family serine protease